MADELVQVRISPKVFSRILGYAQVCSLEISGFAGFNPRTKIIDNLFPLLDQECSSGETEISEEALEKLALSKWSTRANVWWHSHVNMGVFWSGQDDATIEALGRTYPWLISIVVNKKREYKARMDYFYPTRINREAKLTFDIGLSAEELAKISDEVDDKVSEFKPKVMGDGIILGAEIKGTEQSHSGVVVFRGNGRGWMGGGVGKEDYLAPFRYRQGFQPKDTPQWLLTEGYVYKDGHLITMEELHKGSKERNLSRNEQVKDLFSGGAGE